jgi:hypothetical protein
MTANRISVFVHEDYAGRVETRWLRNVVAAVLGEEKVEGPAELSLLVSATARFTASTGSTAIKTAPPMSCLSA